jgi:vacuolar-type H+-ATPase subunit I/STV1
MVHSYFDSGHVPDKELNDPTATDLFNQEDPFDRSDELYEQARERKLETDNMKTEDPGGLILRRPTDMDDAIVAVAKEAEQEGLEHQKANMYVQAFGPFMAKFGELEPQINALNAADPTPEDSKTARTLRLAYKSNRTAAEGQKKSLKEGVIVEGRLIDSLFNVVKNASELKERYLQQVEDFAEIKEQKRRADLQADRISKLSEYGYLHTSGFDLSAMDDATFENLLAGTKATYQAKLDAEVKAKAEVERNAAIKQRHEERARLIIPFTKYVARDAYRLGFGELSDDEWLSYVHSLEKAEADDLAEQKRIADENARLKAEAEVRESELAKERAETEAKVKAASEQAAKEKRKQDALLQAEKEKAARLANELKKQQEAIAAQKKAEADAERKTARAPDKIKLIEFARTIDALLDAQSPVLKSAEAVALFEAAIKDILAASTKLRNGATQL